MIDFAPLGKCLAYTQTYKEMATWDLSEVVCITIGELIHKAAKPLCYSCQGHATFGKTGCSPMHSKPAWGDRLAVYLESLFPVLAVDFLRPN